MRFDVLTLFPDMFPGYLGQSLLQKAIERQLIGVFIHDIRRWSKDKHNKVDDRPYGGGPGMVLKVEPVVECAEAVRSQVSPSGRLVLLTPTGRRLDQRIVEELATEERLVLLCGRYEGFDQRVIDLLEPDEISIGDYVLGGGEVAAMVVIDAVARLIPGVIGDEESHRGDSFSSGGLGSEVSGGNAEEERWLEFGQYTRPREYRGLSVPEVLLSGDHEKIARWRREQSYTRTRKRRADLLDWQSPTDNTVRKEHDETNETK